MKLHENKQLFRQSVEFTARQMRILPIYVEKDYWVTYALYTIFNHTIGKETIFKGGTALVKCFGMIARFSFPKEIAILTTLKEIKTRLSSVEWTIKIANPA